MIDDPTPADPKPADPQTGRVPIPFDFEVFRENDRDAPDEVGALGDVDARRVDALRQPENGSDGHDETRRGAERRAGERRKRRDERTKSVVASPTLVAPPRHRRRYRRSRALLRLVALLMVPVLLTGVAYVWFNQQVSHGSPGGAPVIVTIKAGSSNSEIGDALAKAKVIDNALIFKLYAKWKHHANLKAGEYTLQEHMGIKAAIVQLEAGAHVERLVLRIKPGLWLNEVADQVAAQLKLNPAKFISLVTTGAVRSLYQPASVVSTEGLLFPDTYFFTKKSTELDVLRTMVARFDEVAKRLDIGPAAARIGQTPYRVAIVASLIQSEVKFGNERPLVASVVYNRLKIAKRLEIDATVLYAIQHHKVSNTQSDRATDSPYNTYKYEGLPPTPIAGITEASLKAALNPADTTFLYYVVIDKAGHQKFATTGEEHQHNVDIARSLGLLG